MHLMSNSKSSINLINVYNRLTCFKSIFFLIIMVTFNFSYISKFLNLLLCQNNFVKVLRILCQSATVISLYLSNSLKGSKY